MGLVHDGTTDVGVRQIRTCQQVGDQVPEVVHKVLVQHLGGEAGTADPHLQAYRVVKMLFLSHPRLLCCISSPVCMVKGVREPRDRQHMYNTPSSVHISLLAKC